MDINTQNSSGMMNGMPPVGKSDKKVGPIIGVLIIVLVIIIISLYFFGQRLNIQSSQNSTNEVIRNEASLSSSTEVDAIQADLDKQLQDVDYSF